MMRVTVVSKDRTERLLSGLGLSCLGLRSLGLRSLTLGKKSGSGGCSLLLALLVILQLATTTAAQTGPAPTNPAGPRPTGSKTGKSTVSPASQVGERPATPAAAPKETNLKEPVARQPLPAGLAAPQAPPWADKLGPEHEKYLDQILNHWQVSSADIKRYRCNFTRWEYDAVFVARDAKTGELPAKTQSRGIIKYSAPDKGMFKVENTLYYQAPQTEKEKGRYVPHADDKGEQWICDGKSIYAFDHQKKQLIQTELPPEMHGRAIVDGPLPFMFGADAVKIKQRFWLRVITPKDAKEEYWLEAVPKTRTDAANFKMLHIIIDYKDYLPKAMAMFDRNYDPVKNPSCTNFVFEDRATNWNDTLDKLNVFNREFWEPAAPFNYKKVVERYQPTNDERVPQPAQLPPPPGSSKQATRPNKPIK
ncbi:MAG: TIGR03009 domain-containing protein [Planctomycetota bacterium]